MGSQQRELSPRSASRPEPVGTARRAPIPAAHTGPSPRAQSRQSRARPSRRRELPRPTAGLRAQPRDGRGPVGTGTAAGTEAGRSSPGPGGERRGGSGRRHPTHRGGRRAGSATQIPGRAAGAPGRHLLPARTEPARRCAPLQAASHCAAAATAISSLPPPRSPQLSGSSIHLGPRRPPPPSPPPTFPPALPALRKRSASHPYRRRPPSACDARPLREFHPAQLTLRVPAT